jgi:plasmid stabilization system protein ParE
VDGPRPPGAGPAAREGRHGRGGVSVWVTGRQPAPGGKPLRLGLGGLHSARRGDYRVIYRIDDQRRRVDVVAIEHRSDIYRPRQL